MYIESDEAFSEVHGALVGRYPLNDMVVAKVQPVIPLCRCCCALEHLLVRSEGMPKGPQGITAHACIECAKEWQGTGGGRGLVPWPMPG